MFNLGKKLLGKKKPSSSGNKPLRKKKASGKRKVSVKKASTKKSSTKKSSTKKASTKKASTKKVSTKRASTKKVSTKKASMKKALAKKPSKEEQLGDIWYTQTTDFLPDDPFGVVYLFLLNKRGMWHERQQGKRGRESNVTLQTVWACAG